MEGGGHSGGLPSSCLLLPEYPLLRVGGITCGNGGPGLGQANGIRKTRGRWE